MQRIKLVLLARDCDSTLLVFNYLKDHFIIDTVILERTNSKRKQFRRRLKLLGLGRAIGQVIFMLTIFRLLKFSSRKRKTEIIEESNSKLEAIPKHIIRHVDSLSSQKARDLLRELQPGLLLVNGTRIISKKTLEAVSAPFINIHTGITPAFRGVHGGYWAIATSKKELFGTTIHYVDAGVDTGGIIEQVFIVPDKTDNFYTYPYLQYAKALPVLRQIVQSFADGKKPTVKPAITNDSSLWFHPTIFQWLGNMKRTFIFAFFLTTFM